MTCERGAQKSEAEFIMQLKAVNPSLVARRIFFPDD